MKNNRGIRFLVSDGFGVAIIAWFALVLIFVALQWLPGVMAMVGLFLIAFGVGIWSTIARPEDWIVEVPIYRVRKEEHHDDETADAA